MIRALAALSLVLSATAARADDVKRDDVTLDDCIKQQIDTRPGAPLNLGNEAAPPGGLDAPIPWSEFVVEGKLVDPKPTVKALLAPTVERYKTTLTQAHVKDLAIGIAKFGYQLVGHSIRGDGGNSVLVLVVEPLPIVRKVTLDVHQRLFDKLLDEEVRRRMQLRVGVYLPWDATARACARMEEQQRLEDFLHDEGYFEAEVTIARPNVHDGTAITLAVKVNLGAEYSLPVDRITIPNAAALAIPEAEIKAQLKHEPKCLGKLCLGSRRFTRTQHQADIQKVIELFHKRQYPAVRVQSDFNPKTSFNRDTKTVGVVLQIDQRQRLDVKFEGNDPSALPDGDLRAQLTFDKASSTDDVEVAESQKALTDYLQTRGYYDARVTTTPRMRLRELDRIAFLVEAGKPRETADVTFVRPDGSQPTAITSDELTALVATKRRAGLLGATRATTSALVDADRQRIKEAYRRAGWREATVRAAVATDPAALGNAALTAALLGANIGSDLHVRFTIDEGEPTFLARVELVIDPGGKDLCDHALRQLHELLNVELPHDTGAPCAADVPHAKYKEDDVAATPDRVRDALFNKGRARATVKLEIVPAGPHRVIARYRLEHVAAVKLGSVVVRGNFRTRESIVRGELRFGTLLTQDSLAETARRLRNTGLFTAVNIDVPDLDAGGEYANAVVHVEERYDYRAEIDLEAGYSSYTSLYFTGHFIQRNLFGTGLALDISGTYGDKLKNVDATLTVPKMLLPAEFRSDFTVFYREQDTPAFGLVKTEGFSAALARTYERRRVGTRPARLITFAPLRYDWRVRTRNIDALRPVGADQDQPQVTISTTTGAFGTSFEWDQRVDRKGNLSPLAPEAGFRLFAAASLAGTFFGGQDDFVKLTASASKFWSLGDNVLLRADARLDEGIPLGGAVLLPEVERFFAGGDTTVRGYDDDKMATQIVQVGVPPVANLSQIRVLAAGGNIRALASIDAQYRVWKTSYGSFATAVFTDAGMITNVWGTVTGDSIKPSIGMAIVRFISPLGVFAIERAIPLRPQLGDDPLGRWHISLAARAQF